MEASMYTEAYLTEIEAVNQRALVFAEFIHLQKEIEEEENKDVRLFLELKIRKMQ